MQLCLVILYAFAGLIAAQNDGTFSNPPPFGVIHDYSQDAIYDLGSTVQISWSVSWAQISLLMWQNGNPNFEYLLMNVTNPTSYDWVVRTNKDISTPGSTNGTVFFFSVFLPGTDTEFQSHYFNLTNNGASTPSSPSSTAGSAGSTTIIVTELASTPTATTITMAVTPTSIGPAATSTTTIFATMPPQQTQLSTATGDVTNDGLSTTTKIALGAGIGLGVPLLIAVGVLIGWMLRKSAQRGKEEPIPIDNEPAHPWIPLEDTKAKPTYRMIHEAPTH